MTVSVLLPSYKHPKWLPQTITSVLAQSYRDLELIIVDDGSDDGSKEIIESYAEKDGRIKYEIFPENRGAMVALNRCYELSGGDYIATISSDDLWASEKLELQLKAFEEHETVGAVFALPQFIDENGEVITEVNNVFVNSVKKRTKYEWMNYFFLENCVCYPTSLVKREYYERAGFFRLVYRSLPDFEMWVRLFYCCEVLVLDKELMSFRVHQFNESGKNLGNIIRCQTEHKQILKTLLAQIGSLNELKQIFPGCKSIMPVDDARLIPFYFAQILLEQKKKLYRDLAFDILYDELQKEEI